MKPKKRILSPEQEWEEMKAAYLEADAWVIEQRRAIRELQADNLT